MEDGYAIADQDLRAEIRARFPDCFARCAARRDFMANRLGITLPEEVLPLSNLGGIVMPFVLAPYQILTADR
jgi:hypothetical protein